MLSESANPLQAWNHLPDLPPQVELETKVVMRRCVSAARALAELKAATSLLPNPSLLTHNLVLLEAQASSEIENIVTTHDDLFQASHDSENKIDPATKEALRYRQALWLGVERLRDKKPLCTNLYLDLVRMLKGQSMGLRRIPGTTLKNQRTGEIFYTPPVGETLLRDKLSALDHFINDDSDNLDPLIKVALCHYQFEAIHPFLDGNGRCGRILCVLQLLDAGLLEEPVLYLSKYFIRHKDDYYHLLRAVTFKNAWEEWIIYVLRGIEESAKHSLAKIHRIQQLLIDLETHIRSHLPPRVPARELAELLIEQPYCKVAAVVKRAIAKRQTAAVYLQALVDSGAGFTSHKHGRERIYVFQKMIDLLKSDE